MTPLTDRRLVNSYSRTWRVKGSSAEAKDVIVGILKREGFMEDESGFSIANKTYRIVSNLDGHGCILTLHVRYVDDSILQMVHKEYEKRHQAKELSSCLILL